jgi:cytochrome b pre-mRNA-processing protein 3
MIFKSKSHDLNLYNILLTLSRNIFFYQKIKLPDTFETRIYLMFAHFSILMIITKKKGLKFSQKSYDELFHNIEYNLRESGFGDVTVNKKMKELNKTLYDILLKIDLNSKNKFTINDNLLKKYFNLTKDENKEKLDKFSSYFNEFFNFCFELPVDSMLKDADKFNH